jgi:hypothetical protein
LLELARRRLADLQAGKRDAAGGWISEDECLKVFSAAASPLNTAIFRIRKRLAILGFVDAAHTIERQPENRLLRIGAERIAIHEIGPGD